MLFGEDDPETLETYRSVSNSYKRLGDYKKSLEIDTYVFDRLKKVIGSRDPLTIEAFRGIGISYEKLGDFKNALNVY